jgi:hypothetical protein
MSPTNRSPQDLDQNTFYSLLVLGEHCYRERGLRSFDDWSRAMARLGDRFAPYLLPVYGAVVAWPADGERPLPGLEGPPFLLRDRLDPNRLYVTDREGVALRFGRELSDRQRASLDWITENAPEMLLLAINPALANDLSGLAQLVWDTYGPEAEAELRERIRDPRKVAWLRRTVQDWVRQDREARNVVRDWVSNDLRLRRERTVHRASSAA